MVFRSIQTVWAWGPQGAYSNLDQGLRRIGKAHDRQRRIHDAPSWMRLRVGRLNPAPLTTGLTMNVGGSFSKGARLCGFPPGGSCRPRPGIDRCSGPCRIRPPCWPSRRAGCNGRNACRSGTGCAPGCNCLFPRPRHRPLERPRLIGVPGGHRTIARRLPKKDSPPGRDSGCGSSGILRGCLNDRPSLAPRPPDRLPRPGHRPRHRPASGYGPRSIRAQVRESLRRRRPAGAGSAGSTKAAIAWRERGRSNVHLAQQIHPRGFVEAGASGGHVGHEGLLDLKVKSGANRVLGMGYLQHAVLEFFPGLVAAR